MIGAEFPAVLHRAQHGDEHAFAQLWRDLNPPLLRYLTVAGDPAEDVAADTWASVVKGLARFTGDETAWRAWVFTTARRRAVDAGRRRRREAEHERDWQPWPAFGAAPVDPAVVVIDRRDTAAALALVGRLSPLQAEVVALRVVAGLPVEEVARIVGRTPGAVRVAQHRGLHRLRELLAGPGVTPDAAATLRHP